MKKLPILLVLPLCLGVFHAEAQCMADAGPDKSICFSMGPGGDTTATIGSTAPVTGGTPPYTFQWTFDGFNAYTNLTDATSPNPTLTNVGYFYNRDSVVFVLTVTDANGMTCSDAVTVRFSRFYTLTSGPLQSDIHRGDSVFLAGWILTGSNYPAAGYRWSPAAGLRDTTSAAFWARPDTTTTYAVQVTNTAGCTSRRTACYTVNVLPPLGISEAEEGQRGITIYPNPARDKVYIRATQPVAEVLLCAISGRMLYRGNAQVLDLQGLPAGLYMLGVTDVKGRTVTTKVVKAAGKD